MKKKTKEKTAIHGDWIDETEGATIEINESDGQALFVRVGPVYYRSKTKKVRIHAEPGIWVNYQKRKFETEEMGPVLLTWETIEKLYKILQKRVEQFDATKYGLSKKAIKRR